MIVIRTKDGFKHWTESYSEDQNFLVFETKSKEGKKAKHRLNKDQVAEIAEIEGSAADFDPSL